MRSTVPRAESLRRHPMAALGIADLRARYHAIGAEKMYFAVALIATLSGALLPLVQMPLYSFIGMGAGRHFYDLGLAGVLPFVTLLFAAGIAFVRPAAASGFAAIPLLAAAAALTGMVIAIVAVSSFGLLTLEAGAYAWLLASTSLTAAYSRRIFSLYER